jgi:hypothetical protein
MRYLLALPILLGVLLSSCRHTDSELLYRAVPADASLLLSIRAGSLIKKSALVQQLSPFATLLSLRRETPKKLSDILKDPRQAGLDLDELLLFGDDDLVNAAIIARVANRQKLVETIEALVEVEAFDELIREGDIYHAACSGFLEYFILFNDQLAVIIPSFDTSLDEVKILAATCLTRQRQESILSVPSFAGAILPDDDLSAYLNCDPELLGNNDFLAPLLPFVNIAPGNHAKLTGAGGIAFRDGNIRAAARLLSPLVAPAAPPRPLARAFLDYIPAPALVAFIANGDGDICRAVLDAATYSMRVRMILYRLFDALPDLEDAIGTFPFSSINGEVALAILPGDPLPTAILYAEVKDNRPVEAINNCFATGAGCLPVPVDKLDDDTYHVDFDPLDLYYGIKNGHFYLTTSRDLAANAGVKATASLAASPFAKRVPTDAGAYLHVDIAALPFPYISTSIAQFESLDTHLTADGKEFTLDLRLKDTSRNALTVLADIIKRQIIGF